MRLSLCRGPTSRASRPTAWCASRQDFDDILARHAVKHGARLRESTNVTGPVLDTTGRIVGVTARAVDDKGRSTGPELTYRAPLVVAADGNSSRLSLSMNRPKRATTARWGWPCAPTTEPPPRRRLPRVLAPSCGAPTTTATRSCCPDTAGSSASATASIGVGTSTSPRRFGKTASRTSCAAGSPPCRRSGPTATRPWSVRSAAPPSDGLQPPTTTTGACSS